MSNVKKTYVNAAKRGNQSSPSSLQPGKVISADKANEIDANEIDANEVQDAFDVEDEYEVEEDYKNDPDYTPESEDDESESDEDEAEENEDEAEEDYKNDPDYVPDEEDLESGEEHESDEEEDDYINDPAYLPGYMAPVEYYAPPHEPEYGIEKVFGCDGCDYEWRDGWKEGWKAAMKFIEEQVNQNRKAPEAPTCDNCGIACKPKKCGGSCNGSVMYCNEKCQFIHWKKTHKFACIKK